jgi:hypothetical protein
MIISFLDQARVIVDGDLKSAIGPRDVTDLVEALGFECHLIGGGTGAIDIITGFDTIIVAVVVFVTIIVIIITTVAITKTITVMLPTFSISPMPIYACSWDTRQYRARRVGRLDDLESFTTSSSATRGACHDTAHLLYVPCLC